MTQLHALIIDDNIQNTNILAQLLSEQNISSTQINHPKHIDAALERLICVHIVFLDLEMPGLNGYEVLNKLKTNPTVRSAPVVAYTVHTSEINEAYRHGFHSFIGKPVDPDHFPDQLVRILSGEPVWETT